MQKCALKPVSDLEHDYRVLARIAGLPAAGRALDVVRQHLGCLVAEPVEQIVRADDDPHGEAIGIVLAELQLADPRQQPLDHPLGPCPHGWQ
jgi:hypothetical protein